MFDLIIKIRHYLKKADDLISKLLKCHNKKIDIFAIIILALMVLINFKAPLLTGEPFRPGNDVYFLDFPFRLLSWESIRFGEWPLWNPYNSGGINLLGSNPFFYLLYPLYLLTYLFNEAKDVLYVLSLVQILHLILTIAGMYFLLRKVVKDPLISVWGSILYGFSFAVVDAFVISNILLVNYLYFPWIVLVFYTLEKRSAYANILLSSILIFLMVGGGALQWSIFILSIIFLLFFFRYNPFREETRRKFLTGLGIFLASGIVAFLLGAIEFLPFLEQNVQGARGNIDLHTFNTQQNWTVPWFLSFRLFIPQLFSADLRDFIPNPMIFLEDNFNSYFGIGAALLSITGLFMFRQKWLRNWKLAFVLVFLVALGLPVVTNIFSLTFMKADLVYTRIGSLLPFMGVILAAAMLKESLAKPQKMALIIKIFAVFMVFLIILLISFNIFGKALLGADLDVAYIQKQILVGIGFIFSYLLAFFLFSRKILGKNLLLITLCILAVIEINFLSLNKINPHLDIRPAHEYFERTQSEKILDDLMGKDKDNYRVHNTSVRFGEITHHLGGPYMHYFPNGNIYNHFYEANGYILNMQSDIGTLLTNSKGGYFIRMADLLIYNSLPSLLSIKYIIAKQDFDPYNVEPKGHQLHPSKKYKVVKEFTDGPVDKKYNLKILEIENTPPRFFFTERVEFGEAREKIFELVINPLFDPRNVTYFEGEKVATKTFDTSSQKVLEVKVPSPNQVIVKVQADKEGILVANNFWHKWWRVEVNSEPSKIYRANYLFQGIRVPAGVSTVHFYCEAKSLEIGKYLSITGMFILIILCARLIQLRYGKRHMQI